MSIFKTEDVAFHNYVKFGFKFLFKSSTATVKLSSVFGNDYEIHCPLGKAGPLNVGSGTFPAVLINKERQKNMRVNIMFACDDAWDKVLSLYGIKLHLIG